MMKGHESFVGASISGGQEDYRPNYSMISPHNILENDPEKRIAIPTPLQYNKQRIFGGTDNNQRNDYLPSFGGQR